MRRQGTEVSQRKGHTQRCHQAHRLASQMHFAVRRGLTLSDVRVAGRPREGGGPMQLLHKQVRSMADAEKAKLNEAGLFISANGTNKELPDNIMYAP